LIFLRLAAPVGVRTVRQPDYRGRWDRVWNALEPLGTEAGWSGEIVRARRSG
jgi:hypothetical protein